jgi:hypothetical protein
MVPTSERSELNRVRDNETYPSHLCTKLAFTSNHPGYRVIFNRASLLGFFLPSIRGIVICAFSSWIDKHTGMSYLTWTCIAYLTTGFHSTEFEKVGWDIHSHVIFSLIFDEQSSDIHALGFCLADITNESLPS